ncbi:MAG: hypothetical protein L6R42_007629 [Xanthoria sp. 1 TBL-2021]|nr:MAG: hypothetical protein L6R42_007629 [Xanthoria sp. 1 TBL-2021]
MSSVSGLSAFVGGRHKPPNDEQPFITAEQRERMQARMADMGLHSRLPPNSVEDRSTSEKKQERVSSRQAVADCSRVSTPAFPFQRVPPELDAGAQRPQVTQRATSTTNSVGQNRLPFHGALSGQPKSRGPFDTDSEAADDTTRFSGLTEPDNLPISRKDASGNRVHPEGTLSNRGPSHLSRESLDYYATDHGAGAQEYPRVKTGSDDDGDDEFDDQTQYNENMMLDENRTLDRLSPVDSTTSASRKRKSNQPVPHQVKREHMLGNPSDTPSGAKVSRTLALSGPQMPGHRMAPLKKSVSISSREDESDMEGTRSLHSPNSADYSRLIHNNTRGPVQPRDGNPMRQPAGAYQDAVNVKHEYIPEPGAERTINNPLPPVPTNGGRSKVGAMQGDVREANDRIKQSTSYPAKAEVDLDYEPETLRKMTFQQLADESFDTAPQPTKLGNGNMSLEDELTLDEKLLHLHSLDGSRDHVQSQRQEFFSSLPIDQYEECGDLMAGHFGQILSKFKNARQHKRGLAKNFEEEVAARQKLVERRTVAVAEDLDRLKRAGQDVVRRK